MQEQPALGVVVSNGSVAETNATPSAESSSIVVTMCRRLRKRRSVRQTRMIQQPAPAGIGEKPVQCRPPVPGAREPVVLVDLDVGPVPGSGKSPALVVLQLGVLVGTADADVQANGRHGYQDGTRARRLHGDARSRAAVSNS